MVVWDTIAIWSAALSPGPFYGGAQSVLWPELKTTEFTASNALAFVFHIFTQLSPFYVDLAELATVSLGSRMT